MTDIATTAARLDVQLAEQDAFKKWWDSICRQGVPLRRSNLAREAFMAGYYAATAEQASA